MRALALMLLVLVGCGDDDVMDEDSGPPPADTSPRDTGVDTGVDTGPADSGPIDSGPEDTGVEDVDAGFDAGEDDAGVDSGVDMGVDSGPMCLEPIALEGFYQTATSGDCGDAVTYVEQHIDPSVDGGPCDITFSSLISKGVLGVNGEATIDENGGFTGATLQANTTSLTCDGVWDAEQQILTLTCATDCIITLTHFVPSG